MMVPTRPVRPLATALIILLAAQIGLLGFRAIAFIRRIDLLQRIKTGGFVTKGQAEASDRLVGQSSLLWLLAFAATVVVWLIWQHRAQTNARALTDGGTSISPGWAVGWWFVPFANLVKPFQAVRELWQASIGGTSWREQRLPPVLGAWWAAWLAFNIVGVFAANGDATNVDPLITADRVRLASMVFGIAAASLAIWVVRSILMRQEATIALGPGPTLPPAPGPIPPTPVV